MRTGRRRGLVGQALVVIALAAVALFGVGSLALDVGIGQADRRHLQLVSDAAALAAARTSGTASAQDYVAMLYLQKNLGWSSLPGGCTSSAICPAQSYTVGDYTATIANASNTIDISLSHQRSPVLAGLLGFKSTTSVGAHESAGAGSRVGLGSPGGTFGYALFVQTSVATGNDIEQVQGDVFIGTTLSTQSNGKAGFCAGESPDGSQKGHIVFGAPLAFSGSITYGDGCPNNGRGEISAATGSGSCSGVVGTVTWTSAVCLANPPVVAPTYPAPATTATVTSCTISAVIPAGFYNVPSSLCSGGFTVDFGKSGLALPCVSFLIAPGVPVSLNGNGGGSITAYGATGKTPACPGAASASNRFVFFQAPYAVGATPRTSVSVQGPGCCPSDALTGEVYMPTADWSMSTNAQLTDRGQMIVYSFSDQSGNHPNPAVTYDPTQIGGVLTSGGLQR